LCAVSNYELDDLAFEFGHCLQGFPVVRFAYIVDGEVPSSGAVALGACYQGAGLDTIDVMPPVYRKFV